MTATYSRISNILKSLLLDDRTQLLSPKRLLVLQFLWVLPYLAFANYLERSLLAFRLLCYTQNDHLELPHPNEYNINECNRKYFGSNYSSNSSCRFNQPPIVLNKPNISSSLQALIVIRSAPNSHDYRQYIRDTWKRTLEPEIPVVFVTGTIKNNNLSREAKDYGDILQLDFVDSYQNLSLKMVWIYKYFLTELPTLQHIIAVNDDTVVNRTALKSVMKEPGMWMTGKVSRGYPRLIFNWLPWYVPSDLYPNLCYPPFIQGSSFVITRQAALRIVDNICLLPDFPLDDVFMGLLAKCLGIGLKHIDGFDRHIADRFIVFHYQWSRYSPQEMRLIWNNVHKNL